MAFGLIIDSPFPLPEALPVKQDTPPDVTVTIGTAAEDYIATDGFTYARENRTWWYHATSYSRTLFNCQSGLFDIRGGNEIIIQLYPDADMENVKIFLLGSAMGAVQAQRGRIPIHGGAVVTQNGAAIITGNQNAGKSTMTSAFVHNGYKYLTDDVSSISIEDGRVEIIPAYPQRKLVRDACISLGYDPDGLILVDSERDKLAIRERDNWQYTPIVLSAIIELYHETVENNVSAELVTGREKLNTVFRNLYRSWMHTPGEGIEPADFKKMLTIAAQADIYRVGVPRDIGRITDFAQDIAIALKLTPPEHTSDNGEKENC